MIIELKNCPICKESNWHDLDYMRDQKFWYVNDWLLEDEPVKFKICKECGFVTYDYRDMERLTKHYDEERQVMSDKNIVTCNRKNIYHDKFLMELFKSAPLHEKKILDVGCAQGSFLDYIADRYICTHGNLYGTEWSKAFRDWGKYEYGLNITKDIDESVTYDFISYYHVLEHTQNPDEVLKKAREILSDDGLLYISVPVWFDLLDEPSGSSVGSFETYYHLNHIDVFSKQSFQNLLKTQGFEIIKENDFIYGYTVLCKKCEPSTDIVKEKYQDIVKILETQKEAIKLCKSGKLDEAIELYPKYPDAYIQKSLTKDVMKEFQLQYDVIKKGLEQCPRNTKLKVRMAQLHFQWDENNAKKKGFYSNNIRTAEKMFEELIEEKGGSEDLYYLLSIINAKFKKDYDTAVKIMRKVYEINPARWADCQKYIAAFWRDKGLAE